MPGGCRAAAADWGTVDTDGLVSPGLKSSVYSLLFGDDRLQCVGHPLELLLVCVVEFIHALGERPVHYVVAAGVLGGRLVYHGDYFPQQGESFFLYLGGYGGSLVGVGVLFLVFVWWRDIGQGNTWGCSAAAEVVVFQVYEEPAIGADPLSSVPVHACLDGVEVSFAGYFE